VIPGQKRNKYMNKRKVFARSAQGFVAHNKGDTKKKVTHSQVRHDCLALAYDILYLGDFLPYPEAYLRFYENMCVDYEKVDKKHDFKKCLSKTIIKMASDNLEKKEAEINRVINKAFDRLEAMTKPPKPNIL